MKIIILFALISLLAAQVPYFRRPLPDNELFPSWWPYSRKTENTENTENTETTGTTKKTAGKPQTAEEAADQIVEDFKIPHISRDMTENALNDVIKDTKDFLIALVKTFGKTAEHHAHLMTESTVPEGLKISEETGQKIADIALNKTVSSIGEGSIVGLEGIGKLGTLVAKGTNNLVNQMFHNFSDYVSLQVNKTISPDGILTDLNRVINLILNKIENTSTKISDISSDIAQNVIRKIIEDSNKLIHDGTFRIQDAIHEASQSIVSDVIETSTPYTGKIVNAAISELANHVIEHGLDAINYSAALSIGRLKEAAVIDEVADTLTAWSRVEWNTGEGIPAAVQMTKQSMKVISTDYKNVTNLLPGGKMFFKSIEIAKRIFPPTALLVRFGEVWAASPERMVETIRLINDMAVNIESKKPIQASAAAFKLFKVFGTDLIGKAPVE